MEPTAPARAVAAPTKKPSRRRLILLLAVLAAAAAAWCWVWLVRPGESTDALLAAGLRAVEQGDLDEAATRLDAVLAREPDNAEARLYRAQVAYDAGRKSEAREHFRQVPDTPAEFAAPARYAEGVLLIESGDAQRGEQQLRRAVELNPRLLAPRERLLELYALEMRRDDIRRQLDEIRRLRPWKPEELVLYTFAGQRIESVDRGVAQLRQFLEVAPRQLAHVTVLTRYLLDAERLDEAERVLTEARAAHPDAVELAGLQALVRLRQNDADGAAESLASVRQVPEDAFWFWKACGLWWEKQQDWPRAAACLGRAVAANPEDLSTIHALATALGRADVEAADEFRQRAELLDGVLRQAARIPQRQRSDAMLLVPIVMDVAEGLRQLGRFREAVYWYDHALLLDPRLEAARQGLGLAAASLRGSGDSATPAELDERLPELARVPLDRDVLAQLRPVANATTAAVEVAGEPMGELAAGAATIRLVDVHAAAGVDFQYFNGASGNKYLLESMGGAVAVLDYDLDGWPDLFFPQGCPLPAAPDQPPVPDPARYRNRLFRNLGDGTFRDVTDSAGVGDGGYGQGCTVGDFDNDGDPDLFVANYGPDQLLRNQGDGTFEDVTVAAGITGSRWSSSAGLADLDGDGNLDLYVVSYVDSLRICRSDDGRIATCDPSNFAGEQDRLYAGQGDGTFADVTATSGIEAANGKGLGLVVADLDDDADLDVYVANDGTPNFLFRNESRAGEMRFVETAGLAGVAVSDAGQAEGGMGIACADLFDDGRLDLLVTNFTGEPNRLYRNLGSLFFEDATRGSGVDQGTAPLVGFGVQATDFDLDGRLDLIVANGHIDDFRFRGEPWKMRAQLLQGGGSGRFRDVSAQAGPYFGDEHLGRGVARLDWDRDGDPDVVVAHQDAPAALLDNRTEGQGHWLAVELRAVASPRDAVGATVELEVGGRVRRRQMTAGDGFYASNERALLFGLGGADRVDRLTVRWPSGGMSEFTGVVAGQTLRIVEGHSPRTIRSGP